MARTKRKFLYFKTAIFFTVILLLLFAAAFGQDVYRERYRPQFHYTAKKGWINDPCGLVCCKREYHLFNDHNPFGNTIPGALNHPKKPPSRWSHAVSTDLVHWKQLPVDGKKDETKWVLCDASFKYWIGGFDGKKFTPEVGPIKGDLGRRHHKTEDTRGPHVTGGLRERRRGLDDVMLPAEGDNNGTGALCKRRGCPHQDPEGPQAAINIGIINPVFLVIPLFPV